MKKGDFCVIAAVIVIIAALVVFMPFKAGARIVVKENNKTVYEGSLFRDKTVELKNNTLIIKNGYAYMKKANCKNGICVHTGKISKKGENIICLPNKIVAEIK